MLGLFLTGMSTSSIEYSNPTATTTQFGTARTVLREMAIKTYSSAKNFAIIAALFTGYECAIESYRAKHDVANTAVAGCLTGATMAARSGPQSALFGCAGFAAFSVAVEHFLEGNKDG